MERLTAVRTPKTNEKTWVAVLFEDSDGDDDTDEGEDGDELLVMMAVMMMTLTVMNVAVIMMITGRSWRKKRTEKVQAHIFSFLCPSSPSLHYPPNAWFSTLRKLSHLEYSCIHL